ncbi:MAG: 16S rRNA (uracil(1498)-N(3))-methyltransferase [Verrucomicrobiae bacterium]|nr:16S rRNA (uracil(1498)-N(3))-methyltransferase [Verrucomicrobiae bacterium]
MPRFHIPPDDWNPEELTLTEEEAHHLAHVLRMKAGESVTVFNGRGVEATAEIVDVQRDRVQLKSLSVKTSDTLASTIAIGQAIPKGKNMELIVQKATELGAAAVHPLITDRTIVRIDAREAAKKQEKWSRVALEACKQSGQNWMPEVTIPRTPAEFFADRTISYDLKLVASLQPDTRHLRSLLSEVETHTGRRPQSAIVLIGPEGDFTAAEIDAAKSAGYLPLNLGPIVLRTETAAIHALSILGYELHNISRH